MRRLLPRCTATLVGGGQQASLSSGKCSPNATTTTKPWTQSFSIQKNEPHATSSNKNCSMPIFPQPPRNSTSSAATRAAFFLNNITGFSATHVLSSFRHKGGKANKLITNRTRSMKSSSRTPTQTKAKQTGKVKQKGTTTAKAKQTGKVKQTHYDCKVLTSSGNSAHRDIKLVYGEAELQGFRREMEDAHFACIDGTQVDGSPVSLFAVLDGHCGRKAADLGAKIIPDTVFSHSQLGQNNATALVEGILQADKMIFEQMGRTTMGRIDPDGSTLICALMYNRMLFVACVGDARAVVYDGVKAVPMSVDHKPSNTRETQRIVRCGGTVQYGRVNGCLAVSRALGDFEFKVNSPKWTQREFMVSNVPDIRQINITDATKFLILACDGLWDVLTNDQACEFVKIFLSTTDLSPGANYKKALDHCALQLAKLAIKKGSMDNVSALIIVFHADSMQTNFGGNSNTGVEKKKGL